jgi:hypothetical protein
MKITGWILISLIFPLIVFGQVCPTLPPTIRVGTSCPTKVVSGKTVPDCNNACTTVEVMSLETYVQYGLNDEWIASWNMESLKAGAVAYRTYGAWFVNNQPGVNYDIRSDPCNQAWNSNVSTNCISAANATVGEVLVNSSNVIVKAEYSAENNDLDNPNSSCGDGYSGGNGWPCISDAVCAGKTFNGHGRGMCQWGSSRWADQGKSYTWILDHYYNPGFYYRCNSSVPRILPPNDDCPAATLLTSSTSCNFLGNQTVNNATASGKPRGSCDAYTGTPAMADVWYYFKAQATSHTVTVDPGGSALDAVIVAYNSCSDDNIVGCSDVTGGPGTVSALILSGLTIGNYYYIRVYDYGLQTADGGFAICVTHPAGNCADNYETNDNCTAATAVFSGPLGSGTANYSLETNIGYNGDQDWYKTDLSACGTLTVTLSNLPENYDLELYGSGCLNQKISSSTSTGTTNEQIVFLNSGSVTNTVYARVYPNNPAAYSASSCYKINFQWASFLLAPAVSISANPAGAVCSGQNITFTAVPVNGGTTPGYQWKRNGVNIAVGSSYSSNTFVNGDEITCVVTSGAACTSTSTATSNAIKVEVSTPAKPVIMQVSDSLVSSAPLGNQWYLNSSLIPNAIRQGYKPTQNGDYYTIATINGCPSDPSNTLNVFNVGIIEAEGVSIRIYPNPNDGNFNFAYKAANNERISHLDLYNSEGRFVETLLTSQKQAEINEVFNLNHLQNGLYFLVIRTPQKTHTLKVFIVH